jgi:hypothetical protein
MRLAERGELIASRPATFLPGQGRRIAGQHVPEITVDVDALFAAAGNS